MLQASWAITDANLIAMRYALQSFGGIKEIKLRNEQDVFVDGYAEAKMDVAMQSRVITFLGGLPQVRRRDPLRRRHRSDDGRPLRPAIVG